MKEQNIKIYLLTNKINNKIYIGQTIRDYKARMNNGNGYRECPEIYVEIAKYGVENFEYTTLAIASSKQEANVIENDYINSYNARDPKIGYNINKGGAGSDGVLTKTGKQKLSQSHSKETIEKRRQSRMESQEIQDQVIAAYKSGKTIREIRQIFGFGGNGKVYRILDNNNIEHLNDFSKWTGKTHSDETKAKMSVARTAYWHKE